jgi:hypothetical protein
MKCIVFLRPDAGDNEDRKFRYRGPKLSATVIRPLVGLGGLESRTLAMMPRGRTPCLMRGHKLVSHAEQVP